MVSQKHFSHFEVANLKIQSDALCVLCGFQNHNIFFQIDLKQGCHIPQTSPEWTSHSTKEAGSLLDNFLDKMEKFAKLGEIEKELNQEKSKAEPPIVLDLNDDTCFDAI